MFKLTGAFVLAFVFVGCKPKEVALYEEGVATYGNESQRASAIQLLKLSGDLGHAQSYVFLMEKALVEAQGLSKTRASLTEDEKIARLKDAISVFERASEYLMFAKGKGWSDAGNFEGKIETDMRKAEAALNVACADKITKETLSTSELPAADAAGKIRRIKKSIDALMRAAELYANAIAAGDVSQKERHASVMEKITALKADLVEAEARREADEMVVASEEKLKSAESLSLDSSLSAMQNLENVRKALRSVADADKLCKSALAKCATVEIEELNTRISGKKIEFEAIEEKLKNKVSEEQAEQKRLADEKRRIEELAEAERKRIEGERKRKEEAEESERKRLTEERRQKEEASRKEELRKQSAEYCLDHGEPLTVGAMREIVASLTFKSNSGNEIRDKQNEECERGRFKGRRVHVVGQIKKVDAGWLGGVNIWVTSNGMSVKCKFGQMSKDEGSHYGNGEKINVEGIIDGSGWLLDDLVLTNCSME